MNDYFNRSFDVEKMLFDNALWLVVQAERPVKEFVNVANQIDIRQQDWDIFWKRLRIKNKGIKKEGEIEVMIGDKEYRFTEEEFEVAKQILNNPDPEEISNCCSAGVEPHRDDDHSSICRDCKEGCGIVYVF